MLVSAYQFIKGSNWDEQTEASVDIPLDRIEGLRDEFDNALSTDTEVYEYSAHFVGFSGYIITSYNTDHLVIPKSEVEVELAGEVEFEAGQNGVIPAIEASETPRRFLSVKVAKDPMMYQKEVVTSYTVMSAAGDEICTLSLGEGGEWTATDATVKGYNPGDEGDTYGWVVLDAPAAISGDSESYWVKINTLVATEAAIDDETEAEPRTNTYGAPEAAAPGFDDLITFEATANEKAVTGFNRAIWGVRTSWTLSDAIEPEGVLFNQWRTYNDMKDIPADAEDTLHGNILSGNETRTGYVPFGIYTTGLYAQFGVHTNELAIDGRTHSNLDVLITEMADDATDLSVDANYTLRAYIPEQQLAHMPAPAMKAPRAEGAEETARKYFVVEKTLPLSQTAVRGDDALTGIGDITVGTDGEAEYFNLQGQRITAPVPGQVVIRRTGDKAEKVVMN